MVSLVRLSFELGLYLFALFETFPQVASVVKELRPTSVNGSFVATLPIADSIFDTFCALFCNRIDACTGISMDNPKECILLWTSGKDYEPGVGPINTLWDVKVPYVSGSGISQTYATDNPLNLGIIPSWRMCHTLCGYAGMKMMKAIFDYDEALAIYKLNNVKFYVDGLREVDGDSFYDSEGTLVWSPTMGLNNTINEENTRMTGLTSNWGDVGDIWSEIEYFGKDVKICLCIHK